VVDLGVFRTWLLEPGTGRDGHPTGRRVSFLDGYAIHGKYFQLLHAGQWMCGIRSRSASRPEPRHYPMIDRTREAA